MEYYVDVTPAPVSQLQFEMEKAERAMRGELPLNCRICEILLSWFLDPPTERVRRDLDGQLQASNGDSGDSGDSDSTL